MHKSMHSIIKNTARGLGLALAFLATAGLARAAGFAIYENDARGFAMGNANVGRNDDASAIFSIPAAITQLPGLQVKVGVTLIQPSIDVTTANIDSTGNVIGTRPYSMNSYTQVVPNLYATYRLNDNMSLGLGLYTPFGLKSDFQQEPVSWGGAFNSYYTKIETTQITPTFAYRLVHDQSWAKQISVGVGLGLLYSNIDMRRQLPLGQAVGLAPLAVHAPIIMKGSGWDANYNLSLQWEINDQIAVGLVYRSVTRNAYHAASAQIQLPAAMGGTLYGNAKAGITLPASWNIGVNYSPIIPLNLGIAATYTQWSSWQDITVTTSGFPMPNFNTTDRQIKNWKNVWRYSIGGEYQLNNQVALRAGFVYDKDPVNQSYADFMVPSNDRLIYSIGLGWSINKHVSLDFAYGYLHIKGRDFAARPAEGIFTDSSVHAGHANMVSASGNFRF